MWRLSATGNAINKFKIYPNPNNGPFNLTGNDKSEKLLIALSDFNGRQVMKVKFETENKLIDLNGKTKGIYRLKPCKENDLIPSKKMMVE